MAGPLPSRFRGEARFDVVGFGENSIDHLLVLEGFPNPDEKRSLDDYQLLGGGQIASAMVACARLGLRAAYLGAVGDDALGPLSRQGIADEGVDTSGLLTVPGAQSRVAFVLVAGATRTVLHRRDRRLGLPPEAYDPVRLEAKVLHLDATEPRAALRLARRARGQGVVVSLDIDEVVAEVDELLAASDLVVCAGRFARALTGEPDRERALVRLGERTPGFVCTTHGEEGSLGLIDGQPHAEPAHRVRVVDTTGAGDVYHAGFLYGMLRGWPAAEVMRFASVAAALSCRQVGARTGAPSAAEVAAVLLRQR